MDVGVQVRRLDEMHRHILVLACACACGPTTADPPATTCGGAMPVRLVEGPAGWGPYGIERVDDDVIVAFTNAENDTRVVVVDECAATAREIPMLAPEYATVLGKRLLGVDDDTGAIRLFDPTGEQPPRLLFAASASWTIEVAGGLATVDDDGTLWFHADPEDPGVDAIALQQGVTLDESASPGTYSNSSDGIGPVAEGDGILVVVEGALLRVPVDGGAAERILEGPISAFVAIDDGRRVLAVGGCEPGRDCCSRTVIDRATGASQAVGGSVLPANVVGAWLFDQGFSEPDVTAVYDLEHRTRTDIEGAGTLDAVLDDGRLLAHAGQTSAIVDPNAATATRIEFPALPWRAPTYDDGFFAVAAEPDQPRGTLLRLSPDARTIERIADDVATDFTRTQRHDVLFRTDVSEENTGTLVRLDRDGRRDTIAASVAWFVIPGLGTPDERDEVLYEVVEGDRTDIWRYVLP